MARGIGDNDIVGGGVIREEFETTADGNGYSEIVTGGGHVKKVSLRNTDDCLGTKYSY